MMQQVPEFKTEEEERNFWQEHDSTELDTLPRCGCSKYGIPARCQSRSMRARVDQTDRTRCAPYVY